MRNGKRATAAFCFGVLLVLSGAGCGGGDDDNLPGVTCSSTGTGKSLYVSPNGDDGASGSSETEALRTLSAALEQIGPGDTLFVLPGAYTVPVGILTCGGATARTVIKGLKGRPVLDGQGKEPLGIFCDHCLNMLFENLEIKGFTDIGIAGSASSDLIFRDLVIHENGTAVQVKSWEIEGYGLHVEDSTDILIEGNEVYQNGPNPQVFPDYLMGTGINTFHLTRAVIRENRSYRNIGGGFLIEDSVDVLFENNEAYENDLDASSDDWWDGGLWIDGGREITVRNNLFRDNLGPGIEISDEGVQNPTGYLLENNVSTGNYYGIYIWNFGTTDWPDESIIRRSGNQIAGNSRQDVWVEPWGCDPGQPCD